MILSFANSSGKYNLNKNHYEDWIWWNYLFYLLIFEIVSCEFAEMIFWVSLRNLIVILNDCSSLSIDVDDEIDSFEFILFDWNCWISLTFDSGDVGICSDRNSSISLDLKIRNSKSWNLLLFIEHTQYPIHVRLMFH